MAGSLPCPECEGQGWRLKSISKCCGNLTAHGECRGHCNKPADIRIGCEYCGGHGEVEQPAPVSPYIRDTLAKGLRSESEYLAEREGK